MFETDFLRAIGQSCQKNLKRVVRVCLNFTVIFRTRRSGSRYSAVEECPL